MSETSNKTLIPYIISLVGAAIAIIANFVKYITISSLLFSRKVSVVQLIKESLDDPETYIPNTGDKIVLYAMIAGIVLSVIALLFTVFKKMIPAIIFIILSVLPFLMIGNTWIHYAGAIVLLVGGIWFKIVNRQNNTTGGE